MTSSAQWPDLQEDEGRQFALELRRRVADMLGAQTTFIDLMSHIAAAQRHEYGPPEPSAIPTITELLKSSRNAMQASAKQLARRYKVSSRDYFRGIDSN